MAYELKDKKLTDKFHELGLVEDNMGYWFYPPYSKDFWIISSYGDSISMVNGFEFKKGRVMDIGLTSKYKISNPDSVINKVKQMIESYHTCILDHKKYIEKNKIEKIKEDF